MSATFDPTPANLAIPYPACVSSSTSSSYLNNTLTSEAHHHAISTEDFALVARDNSSMIYYGMQQKFCKSFISKGYVANDLKAARMLFNLIIVSA